MPRIMVVEDEPRIARILQAQLHGSGYDVSLVEDGEGALVSVDLDPPQLLILDVRLPGIDGFAVCQQIRLRFEHAQLPVLMLSALDAQQFEDRGMAAGADAYLTKPYKMTELLKTVGWLLARSSESQDGESG